MKIDHYYLSSINLGIIDKWKSHNAFATVRKVSTTFLGVVEFIEKFYSRFE